MIASTYRLVRMFGRVLAASTVLTACATDAGPAAPATPPAEMETEAAPAARAVEVMEAGEGEATVVFESGLGNDWTPWTAVARNVAEHARVFAYSRPGYGVSEPTEEPRDASHIVEALRALLASRGHHPPYLLVGHSFGGAYMELFAKAHPQEVIGLVLVDSRHRDFGTACEERGLSGCSIPRAVLEALPAVEASEVEGFASVSEQIAAAGGFGAYPVRVLTATSHGGFTPEVESLWESMHGALAREAADGVQTRFPNAGHNLQIERVEDVADAIVRLIPDAAR